MVLVSWQDCYVLEDIIYIFEDSDIEVQFLGFMLCDGMSENGNGSDSDEPELESKGMAIVKFYFQLHDTITFLLLLQIIVISTIGEYILHSWDDCYGIYAGYNERKKKLPLYDEWYDYHYESWWLATISHPCYLYSAIGPELPLWGQWVVKHLSVISSNWMHE